MRNAILYPTIPERRLLLLSRAVMVAEGEGEAIGLEPSLPTLLAEGLVSYQTLLDNRRVAKAAFHTSVAQRQDQEDRLAILLRVGWAHCKGLVLVGSLTTDHMRRFGLDFNRSPQARTSQGLLAEARKLVALINAAVAEGGPAPAGVSVEQLEAGMTLLEQACLTTDQAALQLNEARAALRRGHRRADFLIRLLTLDLRRLFADRPASVLRESMRRFGFRFTLQPGEVEAEQPEGPEPAPEEPQVGEPVTGEEVTVT